MNLIINADDFGLDGQTNMAILESFKNGLCSSTTLMPNMDSFEEACELIHDNNLVNHVGLHLVLSEGYPLTKMIGNFPRFCDADGQLCFSQSRPTFHLRTSEKEALAKEIRAQIKRVRDQGIFITHIDSHYHVHNQWGIATVLIPVVREQRIPYMRLSRNCGPNLNLMKRAYKYIFNYNLRHNNLTRTQWFGNVEDYGFLKSRIARRAAIKSFEVMIHPRCDDKGRIIDGNKGGPLGDVIKVIDSYENAVSFSGAKYL